MLHDAIFASRKKQNGPQNRSKQKAERTKRLAEHVTVCYIKKKTKWPAAQTNVFVYLGMCVCCVILNNGPHNGPMYMYAYI